MSEMKVIVIVLNRVDRPDYVLENYRTIGSSAQANFVQNNVKLMNELTPGKIVTHRLIEPIKTSRFQKNFELNIRKTC